MTNKLLIVTYSICRTTGSVLSIIRSSQMSNKGDFKIDHDNKKAILWATNPMEYTQVLMILQPDIKALGYELVSFIQPNRPTEINWEV